jgi:hypothetical protein
MEVISVPIEKIRIHISSIHKTPPPPPPLYLQYLPDGNEAQTGGIAAKILRWKELSVIQYSQYICALSSMYIISHCRKPKLELPSHTICMSQHTILLFDQKVRWACHAGTRDFYSAMGALQPSRK